MVQAFFLAAARNLNANGECIRFLPVERTAMLTDPVRLPGHFSTRGKGRVPDGLDARSESQAFNFAIDGGRIDAQDFCGPAPIALRSVENTADMAPFDFRQGQE